MGEHGIGPGRKYSRMLPRARRHDGMPDEVDPRKDNVQLAARNPLVDRARAQAELKKLPTRNQTHLARCKRCDSPPPRS